MGWVAFNDARLDGVGEDAPRRPTVRVAVPAPPRTMASPSSFLVLQKPRLAGHDVFKGFIDVGLGEILDPPGP